MFFAGDLAQPLYQYLEMQPVKQLGLMDDFIRLSVVMYLAVFLEFFSETGLDPSEYGGGRVNSNADKSGQAEEGLDRMHSYHFVGCVAQR